MSEKLFETSLLFFKTVVYSDKIVFINSLKGQQTVIRSEDILFVKPSFPGIQSVKIKIKSKLFPIKLIIRLRDKKTFCKFVSEILAN